MNFTEFKKQYPNPIDCLLAIDIILTLNKDIVLSTAMRISERGEIEKIHQLFADLPELYLKGIQAPFFGFEMPFDNKQKLMTDYNNGKHSEINLLGFSLSEQHPVYTLTEIITNSFFHNMKKKSVDKFKMFKSEDKWEEIEKIFNDNNVHNWDGTMHSKITYSEKLQQFGIQSVIINNLEHNAETHIEKILKQAGKVVQITGIESEDFGKNKLSVHISNSYVTPLSCLSSLSKDQYIMLLNETSISTIAHEWMHMIDFDLNHVINKSKNSFQKMASQEDISYDDFPHLKNFKEFVEQIKNSLNTTVNSQNIELLENSLTQILDIAKSKLQTKGIAYEDEWFNDQKSIATAQKQISKKMNEDDKKFLEAVLTTITTTHKVIDEIKHTSEQKISVFKKFYETADPTSALFGEKYYSKNCEIVARSFAAFIEKMQTTQPASQYVGALSEPYTPEEVKTNMELWTDFLAPFKDMVQIKKIKL